MKNNLKYIISIILTFCIISSCSFIRKYKDIKSIQYFDHTNPIENTNASYIEFNDIEYFISLFSNIEKSDLWISKGGFRYFRIIYKCYNVYYRTLNL